MKRSKIILYTLALIVGVIIYAPIFIASWFLHGISRLLLGLSYLGMLEFKYAKDIFKSLLRFENYM